MRCLQVSIGWLSNLAAIDPSEVSVGVFLVISNLATFLAQTLKDISEVLNFSRRNVVPCLIVFFNVCNVSVKSLHCTVTVCTQ